MPNSQWSDLPVRRVNQDHRVREISSLRLNLRADLRFSPHNEADQDCYLIEDSQRSQYYRIGVAEYFLISMFDGQTTVGEAIIRLSQLECDRSLDETQVTAVCKWLIDCELAHTSESSTGERLASGAANLRQKKRFAAWNPLCTKIPLSYPDRIVGRLTPVMRHAFGIDAAVVGAIVAIVAIYKVHSNWSLFTAASAGIAAPSRWLWLGVCWILLKFIHELGHAIACRKHGGKVHEAGLMMVLFAPLAYVDVTSAWRIRSKWKRIHIAAAGMYIELWIASIAAIVWSSTAPGLVNDLCFNAVWMAGVTTLVFNANPLMRFDGYYILSDALEIPNLYGEGQQYLRYLGCRYGLGEHVTTSLTWSWRDIATRVYAILAFAWRIVICVSLLVAASLMFQGVGILLAIMALFLWVGLPAIRFLKHVNRDDALRSHRRGRLALTTLMSSGLGAALVFGVAWPGGMSASAIVQYEPITFVRAASPGFVKAIQVENGSRVETGQVIAVLDNPELLAEARDLEIAIEQSLIKRRIFKLDDEMHSYQAETEQLESLQGKLTEKQRQIEQLTLRATSSGHLISRGLRHRIGMYLDIGDELAVIGDETRKELRIMVPQEELDPFVSHVGKGVSVRLSGGVVLSTTLVKVEPRGTRQAPDDSMYAALGGPLESRSSDDSADAHSMELLSPHFTGVVALPADFENHLRVGQRGVVWFGKSEQSVATVLDGWLRRVWHSI